MDSGKLLFKEFELLKDDLIEAYENKGMRASGNFVDELEVFTERNRAILFGADYTQQLESGRNPGNQPPTSVIEQWIYDKGIVAQIRDNISVSSLAFLIARKIGREGWNREGYGGVNLVTDIVTDERIQKIIDQVGQARAIEFSSEIENLINELEAA